MKLLKKIFSKNKSYKKHVLKSGLFDEEWYSSQYPEVKESKLSPIKHFLKIGINKEYNPSDKFCTKKYTQAYPDIAATGKKPLIHYLTTGKKENRVAFTVGSCEPQLQIPTQRQPLVSVIVASYNYEVLIKETIESILAQTYKNFEIIIVDDGSSDGSIKVIEKYVEKHNNIFLYTHPGNSNRGLPATVKLGIEKSKGEFVAFCESDDYWHPNHLENKIAIINSFADVNIISNNIELFGDEISVNCRNEHIESTNIFLSNGANRVDIRYNQYFNYIPTFSAVMIKRDLLLNLNYDAVVPAWIDFWLYRQILKDNLLFYTDEKLTYWRMHDSYNGISNSEKRSNKIHHFIIKSNKLIFPNETVNQSKDYKYIKNIATKSDLSFKESWNIIVDVCKNNNEPKYYKLFYKLIWHKVLFKKRRK